jgi:hypothetical protein
MVVSLCDYSGRMIQQWADAGYECWIVDLQHEPGTRREGNIVKVGANVLDCVSDWFPIGSTVDIAFAFPPCTHTAVSGARHFQAKGPRGAADAFTIIARVVELLKWFAAPYCWEQPIATTSTYCGPPTHTFDPCDYAGYAADPSTDAYTKRTCLWTGNGFVMPTPKPIDPVKVCPQGSWIQRLGGASDRTKNRRSATPEGFARAVYEANAVKTMQASSMQ